jgi:hypothetical protein
VPLLSVAEAIGLRVDTFLLNNDLRHLALVAQRRGRYGLFSAGRLEHLIVGQVLTNRLRESPSAGRGWASSIHTYPCDDAEEDEKHGGNRHEDAAHTEDKEPCE